MTATDYLVFFFAGLVVFAAAAILLSRQLISSLFSFGLMLLGIAGIYGSLNMEAALLAQLVLYIGGLMILIGFAFQLYPLPLRAPGFSGVRESYGKGLLLLLLMCLCVWYAPWQALGEWQNSVAAAQVSPESLSLKETGRSLLLQYPLEFEWLGVLILAVLLVAGWYLKENYPRHQS